MTTVFHAWSYIRFIKIQSKLRRKKLHRTNQGSNFFGSTFSNWDNVRAPIKFRRESQPPPPSILTDDFSAVTDPSIFTSIALVLLDQSNETSWVFPAFKSTSHLLPQSLVSRSSDSCSEANSSCCHRSDTWSHLSRE